MVSRFDGIASKGDDLYRIPRIGWGLERTMYDDPRGQSSDLLGIVAGSRHQVTR